MKLLLNLLAASACLLGAGCSSMSNGVFALEVNTVVFDDYEVDDPVAGTDLDDEEVNVNAVGAKAAFNTPVVDIIAGYERRELGDADVDQLSAGVRKRFFDLASLQPYLELQVLYGMLDAGDDDSEYAGVALGGGVLWHIGDHIFFDANLAYEATDSVDVGPDDTPLMGLIGRVGVGFAF